MKHELPSFAVIHAQRQAKLKKPEAGDAQKRITFAFRGQAYALNFPRIGELIRKALKI